MSKPKWVAKEAGFTQLALLSCLLPRLRSISQDLRVQHLHNSFAVEAWFVLPRMSQFESRDPVIQAHEYWAQVALESGDFRAFNTAAQELEAVSLHQKSSGRGWSLRVRVRRLTTRTRS